MEEKAGGSGAQQVLLLLGDLTPEAEAEVPT